MTTYTPKDLAIIAKSGGGTTISDVADLIASHCDTMTDAEFVDLRDRVMAEIPDAPFDEKIAARWGAADAACFAEDAAERFTPYGSERF